MERQLRKQGDVAWATVPIAVALVLGGAMHLAFELWPPQFGAADWELVFFGRLPALTMPVLVGGAAVTLVGLNASKYWVVVLAAVGFVILAALCGLGVVVVLLDLPLVRDVIRDQQGSGPSALIWSTAKTIGQGALIGVLLVVVVWQCLLARK